MVEDWVQTSQAFCTGPYVPHTKKAETEIYSLRHKQLLCDLTCLLLFFKIIAKITDEAEK